MEKHAVAGSSPEAQPHRLPPTGNSSAGAVPGAGAGAGAPSLFGSAAATSFSPSYGAGAVRVSLGVPGASMSAAGGLLRAAPVMPRFNEAHDRTQHQLHAQELLHQQQAHQREQQPHFQEQQYHHEQYPQQRQTSRGGTPLDSESMQGLQATSPQQPRPPATPEEKLRIREKYKQRLQERNVQIYQNALEEVMRKERQEAAQRAIFKINCPTRFGQNVHLVGSHAALGEWAVERAVPMTWGAGNIWSLEVKLPRDASSFEYKYIIKEGPHVIWEPGQNHTLGAEKLQKAVAAKVATQSSTADSAFVIEDSWGMGT